MMEVRVTPVVEKSRARYERMVKAYGWLIRDRRVEMGLSVNQAAGEAGMSWNGWRDIEEGGGSSLLALVKAASVLKLELFLEVEEE